MNINKDECGPFHIMLKRKTIDWINSQWEDSYLTPSEWIEMVFSKYREYDRMRDKCDKYVSASMELLEVADLRGDSDLPGPYDDPKMWTMRMQEAWDNLRGLLDGNHEHT